jgi:hypothetical protein
LLLCIPLGTTSAWLRGSALRSASRKRVREDDARDDLGCVLGLRVGPELLELDLERGYLFTEPEVLVAQLGYDALEHGGVCSLGLEDGQAILGPVLIRSS